MRHVGKKFSLTSTEIVLSPSVEDLRKMARRTRTEGESTGLLQSSQYSSLCVCMCACMRVHTCVYVRICVCNGKGYISYYSQWEYWSPELDL